MLKPAYFYKMLVCFIKFSKLLLKGYLLLKRKNIVMENKDLNNGSQENEWDEIIKNLNKKNSGIKEKSEEADIFFQKIKNGLKGKYDDLNFDNTFWGIKDEVESDAAKVEFTAEQQEINDKEKIKKLSLKAEEDLKRKKESDRLKEENDKRIRAIERKEKADKKKLEDKREEFNKALKEHGLSNYRNPEFDDQSNLVIATTSRPFKAIFDMSGNMIIFGDEIEFGDKGLFYLIDYYLNVFCLYRYDIALCKTEKLKNFNSLKEMQKAIYKLDPIHKLGFSLFGMDHNTRIEAEAEIKASMTPNERQKEMEQKNKLGAENKEKQKQRELDKIKEAEERNKPFDEEEFNKLFGL